MNAPRASQSAPSPSPFVVERPTELCVGTSLRTAPIEFLEGAKAAALEVTRGTGAVDTRVAGAVILSTCNRVEVYTLARPETIEATVQEIRGSVFGQPTDEAATTSFVYVREGVDVVRHLCRVAAGLDSLVVGEHEIAGQVSSAFGALAPVESWSGSSLIDMAEAARKASRRARAETGIGRGRVSLSSLAVELAGKALGGLEDKTVLVIGVGKAATLACAQLGTSGAGKLVVANRTVSRARELGRRYGGEGTGLDNLAELIAESDAVLTTTASPDPVLTRELVRRVLGLRRPGNADLLLVDIAVPRDVEPAVAELEGVRVLGLDHLRALSDSNLAARRREMADALAIVEAEVAAYRARQEMSAAGPLLRRLWQRTDDIRAREVERQFGGLEDLDPTTRARIEHFSRSLVSKVLGAPSARLRSVSANGQLAEYSRVIEDLFGLEESGPAE